jgi:hypothetical protein
MDFLTPLFRRKRLLIVTFLRGLAGMLLLGALMGSSILLAHGNPGQPGAA